MANPITWKNVAAPDFTGSNRLLSEANEATERGLNALSAAANNFGQQRVASNTQDVIAQLQRAQSNAGLDQLRNNELSGEALRGRWGNNIDLGKVNAATAAQRTAIGEEQARGLQQELRGLANFQGSVIEKNRLTNELAQRYEQDPAQMQAAVAAWDQSIARNQQLTSEQQAIIQQMEEQNAHLTGIEQQQQAELKQGIYNKYKYMPSVAEAGKDTSDPRAVIDQINKYYKFDEGATHYGTINALFEKELGYPATAGHLKSIFSLVGNDPWGFGMTGMSVNDATVKESAIELINQIKLNDKNQEIVNADLNALDWEVSQAARNREGGVQNLRKMAANNNQNLIDGKSVDQPISYDPVTGEQETMSALLARKTRYGQTAPSVAKESAAATPAAAPAPVVDPIQKRAEAAVPPAKPGATAFDTEANKAVQEKQVAEVANQLKAADRAQAIKEAEAQKAVNRVSATAKRKAAGELSNLRSEYRRSSLNYADDPQKRETMIKRLRAIGNDLEGVERAEALQMLRNLENYKK